MTRAAALLLLVALAPAPQPRSPAAGDPPAGAVTLHWKGRACAARLDPGGVYSCRDRGRDYYGSWSYDRGARTLTVYEGDGTPGFARWQLRFAGRGWSGELSGYHGTGRASIAPRKDED